MMEGERRPGRAAPPQTSQGQPPTTRQRHPAESRTRFVGAMNPIHEPERQIQTPQGRQTEPDSTTFEVWHKIESDPRTFLERPSWVLSPGKGAKLIGNEPLADEKEHLSRRPEVAFVISKFYDERYQNETVQAALATGAPLPVPLAAWETIRIRSQKMIDAIENLLRGLRSLGEEGTVDWNGAFNAWLIFIVWYHCRVSGYIDHMPEPHKGQLQLLCGYTDQNYRRVYDEAERKFAHGLVCFSTLPLLIRPGEVFVSRGADGFQGFISTSWITKLDNPSPTGGASGGKRKEAFGVKGWSYAYDGRFYRSSLNVRIEMEIDGENSNVEITKLPILPLRLVSDEIRRKLERRGRMMWACRHRKLVAYNDGHGERYMVDFAAYRSQNPKPLESKDPPSLRGERMEIPDEAMAYDEPPKAPGLLVFPKKVKGYNLRKKIWEDLLVDSMYNVAWDKKAFRHLVIDDEPKDLLEALVTTKLGTGQGTDLIKGKGQGQIILLHGGPGTGKTFTAESVAEFAEKPLLRITCGDIGTNPAAAEKYLESTLSMAKMWDCVVLLDEAGVFLEKRTHTDLEHNALVSVFLHALEYYEGILILTSNRVGMLDEGFKSRILLSLHYEPLRKSQRLQIWKNFFDRLKTLEEDARAGEAVVTPLGESRKRKLDDDESEEIDFEDIDCCLAELADEVMNGRQIRNVITMARQVAKARKVKMSSAHLKQVIKVSRRLDRYPGTVREGCTDGEVARGEGIR